MSERLISERICDSKYKSVYFDFKTYLKNFERGQTPYTPAVGVCVEMYENLLWISNRGITKHLKSVCNIASDFRKKISSLPIDIPTYPLSNAITPLIIRNKNARFIFEKLKKEYEVIVNPTGGCLSDSILRVAHIGNINEINNTYLVECLKKLV